MNKKLIVLLASTAVLATAITVAACASKSATTHKAAAPVAPEATTLAQTTAATETEAEIINDGQNPVMNFIGNYYGGRVAITVEAEGTNGANISVVWGGSYDTTAVWTMSGTFDEETTSLVYENGYKKMLTLNENGDVISEEILLTDCKGVFVFSYDGVTWDDYEEHLADGMVFRCGNSVEDVCTTIFPEETTESMPEETAKPAEPTATPAPTATPTTTPTTVVTESETTVTESTAEMTEPAHKTASEISGEYACGRATVTIDAADPDNVMIKVVWGESVDTQVIWRISGKYNEETESILYTNAVKKVITYSANGEVELEEVCYTDGNGIILFSYDGFTWADYNENVADNMVFIKQA